MSKDSSIAVLKKEILEEHERKLNMLDCHGALLQKILDAMPKESVQRIHIDSVGLDISATGSKAILVGCIKALRTNGYEAGNKPKAGQPSYYASFLKTENSEDFPRIWFGFTSTQCRRVKTGTRTVVEDVYEVVCDEQIYEDVVNA